MNKICTFSEFLILKEDSAGKTAIYPLGYGGIGNYPDAHMINKSADAVFYLSIDNRLFQNGDAAPFSIEHLPGHIQYGDAANSGEAAPFDIRKLPGKVVPPKDSSLSGKLMPFKNFVKLVEKPKEIVPPDSLNIPK